MRILSILVFIASFTFAITTVGISGHDDENQYLEIVINNDEPIVGFQFNINASAGLEAVFGIEELEMEGQSITLTGYDFEGDPVFEDSVAALESNFKIFGNEDGLIVGFSLSAGTIEDIEPTNGGSQILLRIPWTYNAVNGGTVGIENQKFITPGNQGGPPSYVSSTPLPNHDIVPQSLGINLLDLPKSFELVGAYPNPFNPETIIEYTVPKLSHISLIVYDINGRQIKELVNSLKISGRYKSVWNGVDDFGESVSSGLYIYQMISEGGVLSDKMMLMK